MNAFLKGLQARDRTPLSVACDPRHGALLPLADARVAGDRPPAGDRLDAPGPSGRALPPDRRLAGGEDLAGRADPIRDRRRESAWRRSSSAGASTSCARRCSSSRPCSPTGWTPGCGTTRCATPRARISTPTHGRRTSSTAASGSTARGRRSLSLRNWMMGLAVLFAAGFALADYLRYRRGNRPAPYLGPSVSATAPGLAPPSAGGGPPRPPRVAVSEERSPDHAGTEPLPRQPRAAVPRGRAR